MKNYNFVERAAHYRGMAVIDLFAALRDVFATLDVVRGTDTEGYYLDDASTIRQELARRPGVRVV